MNVIVLGSRGMLGHDLVIACKRAEIVVRGFDLPTLDISKYDNVWDLVKGADWVVNCAAYTNVDGAEDHREEAFAVNAAGARNVARVCLKKKIRMLQVSTDYVFDGMRTRAYRESDQPNPLNVYGASKLAGEKGIRAEGGHYLIMRTQSLFGAQGHNFVKAIVKRLREGGDKPVQVVHEQISAPTYTRHLAEAIVRLLRLSRHGTVHVSAAGECSWYEFARAIALHIDSDTAIEPIEAREMIRPAVRPEYSVLDNRCYRMWSGHAMPSWQEGLSSYLKEQGFKDREEEALG